MDYTQLAFQLIENAEKITRVGEMHNNNFREGALVWVNVKSPSMRSFDTLMPAYITKIMGEQYEISYYTDLDGDGEIELQTASWYHQEDLVLITPQTVVAMMRLPV